VSSRRVAVTGATGFVGRHLVDRLVRDGVSVVALSRSGTKRPDVDDRLSDYTESAALQLALQEVDVVIHLAARAHQTGESADTAEMESRYRRANVDTAVAVAGAARAVGVRRFVLLSSIGVNGNATNGKPFRSDDTPNPVEPYAKSKWSAEQAVATLLREGRTDHVILRPPLVYGPDCPGNFAMLLKLAARAPVIPLGGIRAPRTLIGVDNLVDAIIVAASDAAASRRTFLVADARDTSVSEIMRTLVRGCGRSPSIVLNISSQILGLTASMAGKSASWSKLVAPLQVDGGEFCRVTGWHPPVEPSSGLYKAAAQFINRRAG
jgi:UDP-N-acetyl-alpha-D-quinovosamine dehydrogenase